MIAGPMIRIYHKEEIVPTITENLYKLTADSPTIRLQCPIITFT